MIRSALLLMLLSGPLAAQDMPVPSGLSMVFDEVILEPETGFARFRFLAPGLTTEDYVLEKAGQDTEWLCNILALPALRRAGWEAKQIVVSIADRSIPFGATDPEVTQIFEGFSIQGDACQWEPF